MKKITIIFYIFSILGCRAEVPDTPAYEEPFGILVQCMEEIFGVDIGSLSAPNEEVLSKLGLGLDYSHDLNSLKKIGSHYESSDSRGVRLLVSGTEDRQIRFILYQERGSVSYFLEFFLQFERGRWVSGGIARRSAY